MARVAGGEMTQAVTAAMDSEEGVVVEIMEKVNSHLMEKMGMEMEMVE